MIPHCMDDFARRAQAQLEMQRLPLEEESSQWDYVIWYAAATVLAMGVLAWLM
jgi:hypothetical protein